MPSRRDAVFALAVVAGLLVSPMSQRPAHALGDAPAIVAAISALQSAMNKIVSSVGDKLMSSITSLGGLLEGNLTSGFTQLTNYLKAQVSGQEQIADANNTINAQLQRDLRNAALRDEHATNSQDCANLTSGQAAVVAVHQARDVEVALDTAKDARNQARKNTPSWAGGAQAVQAANRLHMSRYCSDAEAEAGMCTQPDVKYVGADQSAASLVGVGAYASQQDVNAASDYGTNLIEPVARPAIRGSVLNSVAGQALLGQDRQYRASMSLAHDVVNDVLSWHTANVPLSPAQIAEASAEGLHLGSVGSQFQALDLEVNRHFGGLQWQASLQAMPEKSVMVQIAVLLAQQQFLTWKQLALQQKQALMQAAQLAHTADATYRAPSMMPAPNQ